MQLKVNGEERAVPDAWRDDTLLMLLREALGLVGAKIRLRRGPMRRLYRPDR